MKMASTAADAAVDAPKISRNSRSQPIWYTRAQKPDPKSRNPAVQVRPPTALGATPGSASGRGRIREKLSARRRVKYNLRAGSAQRFRIRTNKRRMATRPLDRLRNARHQTRSTPYCSKIRSEERRVGKECR